MSIFGFSKPNIEKMKTQKDVKGLMKALKNKDHNIKVEAIEALGEIGNAGAVESLVQILNAPEKDIQIKALEALGEIKDERVVEPLIQALNDRDMNVRQRAAEALGKIQDKRAVEPLVQALNDRAPGVQQKAAEALGEIKDERAVEPLIQALKKIDSGVRQRAAEALGRMKDKRAVGPLIQTLKSEDTNVQRGAMEALAKMGVNAEEAYIRIVEDSSSFQEVNTAIAALKRINERAFERAVGIIFDIADEKNERRNMACRVIEANMGLLLNTPSVRELSTEVISIFAGMKEHKIEEIIGDLTEMIPRICPYMVGCDPYEEIFRDISARDIDAETTTLVVEGVLNFLQRASKNIRSSTLKRHVEKLTESIYWRNGVCPVGEVDLKSEAMARKVLLSLPIISPDDPRRNTDPATSTYFDYDDRIKTYSLNEAARNVYSYWAFRASAQTDRYCKIVGRQLGRELQMARNYKYPDGSGGGRGFTIARLDDNEFLFYGRDLEQWKTNR